MEFFLITLGPGLTYFHFLLKRHNRFHAKSVDSDQTSHSAASDLGLHFLPVFLLWDTRGK